MFEVARRNAWPGVPQVILPRRHSKEACERAEQDKGFDIEQLPGCSPTVSRSLLPNLVCSSSVTILAP